MRIIKKIQFDKNGRQYILLRIDVYFTKYCLAIEIDEKGHIDRDFDLKKKKTRGITKKNLTAHLLELILVKKILM